MTMSASSQKKTLPWALSSAMTNRISPSVRILKQNNPIGDPSHLHLFCLVETSFEARKIGEAEPTVEFVLEPTLHESSCVIDVDSHGGNLEEACRFAFLFALAKTPLLRELDCNVDGWYFSAVNSVFAAIATQKSPAEQGGLGADFWVFLRICERVVFDGPKALLHVCWARSFDDPGMCPDEGSTEICPICMEVVASGGASFCLPGCRHAFHTKCLGPWFERAGTCPMCRRDMRGYLLRALRELRSEAQ